MNEHAYPAGDRVWWLQEDSRQLRFTADVPAVITQMRHQAMTIRVTNLGGRTIAVHVRPEHLRPREDA